MSNIDWIRLACIPGIGAARAMRLINHYGDPGSALAADAAGWAALGLPKKLHARRHEPDTELLQQTQEWLTVPGHDLVTRGHMHDSPILRTMDGAPAWLYAIGDTDLLTRPAIAIVGSRNPTPAGIEHARDFAAQLARSGFVIVSGLARGIDAAAHEGALAANGMTIAVCGTGLDRVYPAANKTLAERIAANGLLLSEFNLGTLPARGNFPRRNRIIAGLSSGTLVVEAARASGSLITARMALEAGRDVFALPGSVHNPLARGCHQLIREGAKLVEMASDIFEDIAPTLDASDLGLHTPDNSDQGGADAPHQTTPAPTDDSDDERLLAALGHAPARIDDLVERTGWPADAVSSTLLILELQGRVATTPGGAYMRTHQDNPGVS